MASRPLPPTRDPVFEENGQFTLPWRLWFQSVSTGGLTGPPGPAGPPGTPGKPGKGTALMALVSPFVDTTAGAPGPPGLTGPPGSDGEPGEDGWPVPGPAGARGATGAAGLQGPPGTDGEPGDDGWPVPGPQGAAGPTGSTGPTGPTGPAGGGVPGWDGEDGDSWPIPGPQGPTGAGGSVVTGTFTPAITFGGASVGITYVYQLGEYIQIGNWVYVTINIELSSKGSSTGNAAITGLPFACDATTDRFQIGSALATGSVLWILGPGIFAGVANTVAGIFTQASAAVTNGSFGNNTQLVCHLAYFTS